MISFKIAYEFTLSEIFIFPQQFELLSHVLLFHLARLPQVFLAVEVSVSSITQLCQTLQPVDYSIPDIPVHHELPELTQTHVHRLGIPFNHLIPCYPLLLPFCLQSFSVSGSFPMSQ